MPKGNSKFVNFMIYLAIVSIIGFVLEITLDIFQVDLSAWFRGLMFIIIGAGIIAVGNVQAIRSHLKDGRLIGREIADIFTVIIGIFAVLVGIVALPIDFLNKLDVPAFDGIRALVAFLAIVMIIIQTWFIKR